MNAALPGPHATHRQIHHATQDPTAVCYRTLVIFAKGDYVRIVDVDYYTGKVARITGYIGPWKTEQVYSLKLGKTDIPTFSDRYLELEFTCDSDGYPKPPAP